MQVPLLFLLVVALAGVGFASRRHEESGGITYRRPTRTQPILADRRSTSSHRTHFEEFKKKFNKEYSHDREEARRYDIFKENLDYIHEHNEKFKAGKLKHSLDVNEFADLTPAEYGRMNGFRPKFGDSLAKGHGSTFLSPHHVQVPDEKDWRKLGYVTKVKNQGQCGSCWSFSATGALEGQHFRKTGRLVSLSEQNLVDCSTTFGNNGCEGGLMDQAFQYIKANDGIDLETDYPYEARDDKCRFKRGCVGADDKGFQDIDQGNETALKIASASVGPISVAIDASHRSFQFYKNGVYVEPECSSTQLDHGVLVVGYGTSEEGEDYWIVKNSWGPEWGRDGYVYMARNRKNQCGIASKASFPLV